MLKYNCVLKTLRGGVGHFSQGREGAVGESVFDLCVKVASVYSERTEDFLLDSDVGLR